MEIQLDADNDDTIGRVDEIDMMKRKKLTSIEAALVSGYNDKLRRDTSNEGKFGSQRSSNASQHKILSSDYSDKLPDIRHIKRTKRNNQKKMAAISSHSSVK